MQVYDPTMHDVKQAIQKIEWAVDHLEDYLNPDVPTNDPDLITHDPDCDYVEDCRDRLNMVLQDLWKLI